MTELALVKNPFSLLQPAKLDGTISPPNDLDVGQSASSDGFNDDWCLTFWLNSSASKSLNTRRSYLKEARRFRAFLMALRDDVERNDHLLQAGYEDAARYVQWIEQDQELPLPAKVAARLQLTPMQMEKPKNSPVVLRQAVVILFGFYEELVNIEIPGSHPPRPFKTSNPFRLFRKRFSKVHGLRDTSTPDAPGASKALSDDAWQAVWAVACKVPEYHDKTAVKKAARTRLVIAMLRATWERRSAVASIRWQDIQQGRSGTWFVLRVRKGTGAEWAPVPDELIAEIKLFRKSLGRDYVVTDDEKQRSVFWIGGKSAGYDGSLDDETIYRTVKEVFIQAASDLDSKGLYSAAAELRRPGAGPHTIRHTMATQYLESGGDMRHAQKALNHSSIEITSHTYDTKRDETQANELSKQWIVSTVKDI